MSGSKQLELTADDLSRHPDSLLSALITSTTSETATAATDSAEAQAKRARTDGQGATAPSTAGWLLRVSNGWKVDLEAMDFPVKHDFKVLDLAAAATLLHTIYTQDVLPQVVWKPLLDSCPNTATVSDQAEHDASLHDDVFKLLDYFNIPGTITHWLPPVASLSLQQWRLLNFVYTCHAMQNVQAAVDTMMAYKPHHDPHQPAHTAVFVVYSDEAAARPFAQLTVRVATEPPPQLLASIDQADRKLLTSKSATGEPQLCKYNVYVDEHNDMKVLNIDIDGNVGADSMSLDRRMFSRGGAIGPTDRDYGRRLVSRLSACVRGTRVMFGCIGIHVYGSGTVDAWVLRW